MIKIFVVDHSKVKGVNKIELITEPNPMVTEPITEPNPMVTELITEPDQMVTELINQVLFQKIFVLVRELMLISRAYASLPVMD